MSHSPLPVLAVVVVPVGTRNVS